MNLTKSKTNVLRVAVTLVLSIITIVMAKAQNEQVYAGFTATDGTETNTDLEGYHMLVDGKYLESDFSKWGTANKGTPIGETGNYYYVEFHSNAPIPVAKYILTTGNDNEKYKNRNPKSWILKAKLNESDSWTTIAEVNGDTQLQDVNYTDYEYEVSVSGTYQYFRFMVSETKGNSFLQLGELRFKGIYDPTDLAYTSISGVKPTYFYTGNAIDINCIVKTHNNTELQKNTHYTISFTKDGQPATEVKDKGVYTLTLTGKGDYKGTRSITFEVNNKIEIGVGGVLGDVDLPTFTTNMYSLSQQIYTADEIGMAGSITSIDFYNKSNTPIRQLDIYMVNTDKSSFANRSDWVAVSNLDKVFTGSVTFTPYTWTTIKFDRPFEYDGRSNLLLVVDDNTNRDEESGSVFYIYKASGQAIISDSYSTNFDPSEPGRYEGTLLDVKNQIKLGITPSNETYLPTPIGLTCTATTSKTATLEWTETGEATTWQVCLNDDDKNLVNVTRKPFTLTGLTEDLTYTVRVRAIDGQGHKSNWSEFVRFVPSDKTQIGSGYDNNEFPVYTSSKNSLTQQIYTVAELGKAAAIMSIDFYCSQNVDHEYAIDIFMVSTDKSSFDSKTDWIAVTDANRVYSGKVTFTQGWNSFVLDAPFDYDGDSNVAIMVDARSTSDQNGSSFLAYSAPNQAISYISDTYDFDPINPLTENSSLNWISNTKNQIRILKADPLSCPKPTALAYSDVTAHSASLSWNSDASAWQICINGDESHLIDVTKNTFTLTNLDAETEYTVKVRTVCGGSGGVSYWSRTVKFTTPEACPTPTELNVTDQGATSATLNWTAEGDQYSVRYRKITGENTVFFEDFENGIPTTWTKIDNDGDGYNWLAVSEFASAYSYNSSFVSEWPYDSKDAACSPSFLANNHLDSDNWLVSPQLTLKGTLKFYAKSMASGTNTDSYEVLVSTKGTATSDFTVIQENREAPTAWGEVSIDLSKYEGLKGYIAIRHLSYDKYVLAIDNFGVYEPVATEWITQNNITANSLAINNLTPGTKYQWQVQKVCGGIDGSSKWAGHSFTTVYRCSTPTYLETSELMSKSAILKWTSDADAWQLCLNNDEANLIEISQDDVTISEGTVTYTLTGLTAETEYTVKVRGNCGAIDGVSAWSRSTKFTTLEKCPTPTHLTASYLMYDRATIKWKGESDNYYNVKYRQAAYMDGIDEQFNINSLPLDWTRHKGLVNGVLNGTVALSGNSSWAPSPRALGSYNMTVRVYGTLCNYWLVSPEVTIKNGSGLSFDLALTDYMNSNPIEDKNAQADDRFVVLVFADNAWHILREWNNKGSQYVFNNIATKGEHVSIDISAYIGKTVKIAFYCESTEGDNGDNELHLDNVGIGQYFNAGQWQNARVSTNSFDLTELPPDTKYEIQVQGDYGSDGMSYWSDIITFNSLEKKDITFAPEGFATYFSSRRDVALPTGMKARIVINRGNEEGKLIYKTIADGDFMDAPTNIVPDYTAVLLQVPPSNTEQTIAVGLAKPTDDYCHDVNLLDGSETGAQTTGGKTFYKLTYSNNGDNFGWYWGAANGGAFSSPAHKAWLALPATARDFLPLPDYEETTGIVSILSPLSSLLSPLSEGWYTLDGRKLAGRPQKKGVYVKDGNKVIIK